MLLISYIIWFWCSVNVSEQTYLLNNTTNLSIFLPSPPLNKTKLGCNSETRQSKWNCREAVVWLSTREFWKVFTPPRHRPSVPQLCITPKGRADARSSRSAPTRSLIGLKILCCDFYLFIFQIIVNNNSFDIALISCNLLLCCCSPALYYKLLVSISNCHSVNYNFKNH